MLRDRLTHSGVVFYQTVFLNLFARSLAKGGPCMRLDAVMGLECEAFKFEGKVLA